MCPTSRDGSSAPAAADESGFMKQEARYSLQRTMIIYFLLIGFASLLVGLEFVADTDAPLLRETLLQNVDAYLNGAMPRDAVFLPIDRLRGKAILMLGIILVVAVIVLTMFIKNITEPLQHMIEVSKNISTGDLSQTIRIHSANELAELGSVINEMSSNLQEIILMSRRMCQSGEAIVSEIRRIAEDPGCREVFAPLIPELDNLKQDVDTLGDFTTFFKFYTHEDKDPRPK